MTLEAEAAASLANKFIEAGTNPYDIGIITPYRGQAELILKKLEKGVECATVYRYQGREKRVVIMSMVNSNLEKKGRDFVAQPEQVNVGLTRGMCRTVILGDSETLRTIPLMNELYLQLGTKNGISLFG